MTPQRRIPNLAHVLPRAVIGDLKHVRGVSEERHVFGGEPQQHVLAYVPEGLEADTPWVYWLHGGGWSTGAPWEYAFIGRFLAAHGFPAVLGGYRLWPDYRWPIQLGDARCGLDAALEQMQVLKGRPIVVSGFSAGGQLAAMMALEQRSCDLGCPLKGLLTFNAPLDFSLFYGSALETSASYMSGLTGHDAPWPEADPLSNIEGPLPPTLVVQGENDEMVPPETAPRFVEAAKAAGSDDVQLLMPCWERHSDGVRLFLEENDDSLAVLEWLSRL